MIGLQRHRPGGAVIRRLLRFGAAAGSLLAILVALPWALVRLDRLVLPQMDWQGLAAQPLTAPSVVLAATAAGWVLWAWLLSAVARDGIDRLRRRTVTRRRLPVPLHQAVSALTGAAVLISDSITGHATRPAQPPQPAPPPAAAPVTTTLPESTLHPTGAPSPSASDRSPEVSSDVSADVTSDVSSEVGSSVAER